MENTATLQKIMKTNFFKSECYQFQSKLSFVLKIFFIGSVLNINAFSGNVNRAFNGEYSGEFTNRIAFPIGGFGAGMVCLEGTGAISHVSVRNAPDIFNEPYMFAALCIKNDKGNIAKVIEGPVPEWKYFGQANNGDGLGRATYGLPRFGEAHFTVQFPFGEIKFKDENIPIQVKMTGWSPFIPGDVDNSSLPVGALEYHFFNTSDKTQEAIFSYNSQNFMQIPVRSITGLRYEPGELIKKIPNGFLLWKNGTKDHPEYEGGFAFFVEDENTKVNYHWFRGGHFDTKTINWMNIEKGIIVENPPIDEHAKGASIFVPFTLKPGEHKTIRLQFCWYVPNSTLRTGGEVNGYDTSKTYSPWYSGKFKNINDLTAYWRENYNELFTKTQLFTKSFYESTLPPEVMEAVAANLAILKSPTILRQTDGKMWAWEGCRDNAGCGPGSCTHVWNYAQAIPHLFPSLERTLRNTEFNESQTADGYQKFRSSLPIRPAGPGERAAADGQLGGIMKVYRDWRISADSKWLKKLWPQIKQSMDYCINKWDPKHKGILEEPHHNTYDIEFWGPDGMCTSFYLGALTAFIKMGDFLDDNVDFYKDLLEKGKTYIENDLYNGEYFIQKVQWKGLVAKDPVALAPGNWNIDYSEDALPIFEKEGPKYQYASGCLSDGVLGFWMAKVSGIDENIVNPDKIKSHLNSVYKFNLRKDLTNHVNPQRPSYALGSEGGLLLCTWPNGGKPTLPFIYSDEVWTGIEYQVASHLIFNGMVDEGLEIIRICRRRYDGRIRNPFSEYEFGYWYGRALASYGLIQALTGIRYDAIDKTLFIDSKIGDSFKSFISTETGFGIAGLQNGKPFIDVKMGTIPVNQCIVSEKKFKIKILSETGIN